MRDGTGRCPETQHLEIDHIHNVARGGGNADSNLQALCPWHHQVKSAWEAAQGVKANRSTSQTHPWHQQPRSKQ
jgi:5-methylcytosine-specific restriction endonuclease McrA